MSRRIRRTLTLSLLGVVVAGCAGDEETPESSLVASTSVETISATALERLPGDATIEMLEEGRRLYVVCSVCHGLDGGGTQLGSSLRDGEWLHTSGEVAEIAEIIRTGIASPREYPVPMPVMGGGDFDEQQIRAVSMYVYALHRGAL